MRLEHHEQKSSRPAGDVLDELHSAHQRKKSAYTHFDVLEFFKAIGEEEQMRTGPDGIDRALMEKAANMPTGPRLNTLRSLMAANGIQLHGIIDTAATMNDIRRLEPQRAQAELMPFYDVFTQDLYDEEVENAAQLATNECAALIAEEDPEDAADRYRLNMRRTAWRALRDHLYLRRAHADRLRVPRAGTSPKARRYTLPPRAA